MQVEIELGARLGRSIAKSTTSTVTVPKPHEITFDIPIEKIVRENVKEAEQKDSAMARSAHQAILSSTLSSVSTGAKFVPEILGLVTKDVEELEKNTLRQMKIVLEMSQISLDEATGTKAVQCLLQEMVEYSALIDMYRAKLRDMQSQLKGKEIVIEELKALTEQNSANRAVPEIAIKVAAVIENPDQDCLVLASLLKNLIENRGTPVKCWNDDTKSLFATILDYGGPALARIVKAKIGGPSLQTMYRTTRCNYAMPVKLEERTIKLAASFYKKIGYGGMLQLAVDATAVIPFLHVKENRLIGLATENECVVTTAQDIMNVVKSQEYEKAKQANAFLPAPLQEHVPSFVLAISPVYNGEDHALVRHWFNQVALWGSHNDITVARLGADGDSKVRKYYVDCFRKNQEDRNDVISLNYDSFDFNIVFEDFQNMDFDVPVPTIMFPDWRHLIKKWRNQLLNVKRILIIGEGATQTEHIMKVFDMDRIRSGLWKSDVFVKDRQNVNAAIRILQKEVRVCDDDAILAGHSLILSMKMFSLYFPNHIFHPWTFGSQKCEELFGKLRCFC